MTRNIFIPEVKNYKFLRQYFLFIFLFFTIYLSAQDSHKANPTELSILTDSNIGKIDLQFKNDNEVQNLLVFITDSAGHTVFLENLYRFKGLYKKTIDLKETGKGSYTLKVIKDEERINRKINIQ